MMLFEPNIQTAIMAGRTLSLCHIAWPSGDIYTHTGTGEKYWGGQKWIGVGEFASIGAIDQGTKTGRLSLQLRVTDTLLLNEVIKDDAVGSEVKLYLAAFNQHRRITATQLIYYGFVAETPVSYDNPPMIDCQVASHRERRNEPKQNMRLTHAAWRARHPNDSYCDDVEYIAKGPLASYEGNQRVGRGVGGGSGGSGGGRIRHR